MERTTTFIGTTLICSFAWLKEFAAQNAVRLTARSRTDATSRGWFIVDRIN